MPFTLQDPDRMPTRHHLQALFLPAAAVAGLLLLVPEVAAAQAVLRPGVEARGELRSGDLRLDDNTYADLWRFSGTGGQSVRVTMRAKDFDAYLAVGYADDSGEWHLVEADDDGAGGTDAQVNATLPRNGEYVVRANTLSEGETGGYTLSLEIGAAGAPAPQVAGGGPPPSAGTLSLGTPATGELRQGDEVLEDESFADTWRFQGRAGQQLDVTLRSPDFDAYLVVGRLRNGEFSSLESDDDAAGGTDSKVSLTLDTSGEYLVRANTLFKNKTGRYTLLVAEAGGPVMVEAPATGAGGNPLVSSTPGARMPLVLGQELSGSLGAGDDKISDGSYADIWVYQGRRGETLTMIQRSRDVDSYLTFGAAENGRWTWQTADNNGAGGKDSRLVVTLERDGEYWVRPNALFSGEGRYTLVVTSDRVGGPAPVTPAGPAPTQPAPSAGPLQPGLNLSKEIKGETTAPRQVKELKKGEEMRGQLTTDDEDSGDGTFVDTWVFEGRKGQVAIVSLKSEEFRPYLLIGRAPGRDGTFTSLETDGASVGEAAKVTIELPANGRYWVRANTFDKATGKYTIKLRIR